MENFKMEISEMQLSEIDSVVSIWTKSGLTRPWNDPRQDIEWAIKRPSSTILAGRIDGRIIATVMVGFDGHRGWVYYLAVDENYRGNGYGKAMMRAAESWLTKQDIPKLLLMVRKENNVVVKFYEGIGYTLNDVIVMQKVLNSSN